AARDDAGPGRDRAPRKRDGSRAGGDRRAARAGRARAGRRQPRLQPRLAHRARSAPPADRFRGGDARGAGAEGKPRRPVPRRLPQERSSLRQIQHRGPQSPGRRDAGRAPADPGDARRAEADHRGDEVTAATFSIWRGDGQGGAFRDYDVEVSEGMVVLDAVHRIQAEQANDLAVRWNCKAGKCGSCSAEIDGLPRLMCMTRLSDLPLERAISIAPMKTFPPIRDLVTDVSWNFEVKKRIKKFKPRAPDA